MTKYNLGGTIIGNSRTSSVMLFGDGKEQQELGTKKRNSKMEKGSVRSVLGRTTKSVVSRQESFQSKIVVGVQREKLGGVVGKSIQKAMN